MGEGVGIVNAGQTRGRLGSRGVDSQERGKGYFTLRVGIEEGKIFYFSTLEKSAGKGGHVA